MLLGRWCGEMALESPPRCAPAGRRGAHPMPGGPHRLRCTCICTHIVQVALTIGLLASVQLVSVPGPRLVPLRLRECAANIEH